MNRAPRIDMPWLMRLSILAAMIMLVGGVGMLSGYFGGMPEAATPTAGTPGPTSQAALLTPLASRTVTAVVAINASATPEAQITVVEVIEATATRVTIVQVSPAVSYSPTSGVGSVNRPTAMAVAAESTAAALTSVVRTTSTARVASLATAAAASTAETNSNATATAATAATAEQIAAAQQTQQAQQPPPTQPAQQVPATQGAALGVVFEDGFYQGIDIRGAAREQFGAKAVLYSRCEGLNCWYVRAGGQVKRLDLKRAVAWQYGEDWTLVAVGAGKSDWRAIRFADLSFTVLPVMMVSSDRLYDVEGVNIGLARFRTVLANSQYWYYLHVGKTFRLLQPVIVTTERTSAQWNTLSGMNTKKEVMAEATWSQYARHLPAPGSDLRVVIAPYTGENYTIAQGAHSMPGFAIVPALTTSLWCPQSGPLNKSCQSASYLVGQALGLSFGLVHSCAAYPRDPLCHVSLMQEGKPPGALLLRPEIDKLEQSPFFTRY